jgi:hypothetical protein
MALYAGRAILPQSHGGRWVSSAGPSPSPEQPPSSQVVTVINIQSAPRRGALLPSGGTKATLLPDGRSLKQGGKTGRRA